MKKGVCRKKFSGFAVILLAAALAFVLTAGCNDKGGQGGGGGGSKHKVEVLSKSKTPKKTDIKQVPEGEEFSGLAPEQKAVVMDLINTVTCNCGCNTATIAQCRIANAECTDALQQVQLISEKVKAAAPMGETIREMYAQILARKYRANLKPLLDSVGAGKDKDFMVSQIAKTVANVDVATLKQTNDEIKDARAVAALFLGENKKLLKYLEGTDDEYYTLHGITFELLPETLHPIFEYYYFSARPELRAKIFSYLNPSTPEQDMIIGLVTDLFSQAPDETEKKIDPGNAQSLGPADAPIVIIEFGDFQCPYSKKVQVTLDQVMKNYAGKVRRVWKNFPLSFHQSAKPAAFASMAAGKQGKFWEMHRKIFENQSALSPEKLDEWAVELGLNMEKFKADMASPEVAAAVDAELNQALKDGVQSTPTLFINGAEIKGALPYCGFMEVIESKLKR